MCTVRARRAPFHNIATHAARTATSTQEKVETVMGGAMEGMLGRSQGPSTAQEAAALVPVLPVRAPSSHGSALILLLTQ